jgi:hypothetical protein
LTLRRHDEIGEPLCCGWCAVHGRQAVVGADGKRIGQCHRVLAGILVLRRACVGAIVLP